MLKGSGWRWVVAAVLVAGLALGLGFVLRDVGLSAAANVAQLVSLAPIFAALISWPLARRTAHGRAGARPGTLGELLGTIADTNGLTGQDLRARLHPWGGDAVDAYLSGARRPGWDFVVAFLDVVAGDDRLVRELLERRIRPVWAAGAEDQPSSARPGGSATGGGIVTPEIREWITAVRTLADARHLVARIQESISRNEVVRTVLAEMLSRLSRAVTLLTAERDSQDQDLAAPERSSGSARDTQRRLSEAERLSAETAQRLEDSERQRRVAERLRDEAIGQAEQGWQRLAALEHRPVSAIAREAVVPQTPGDHADALLGDTDRGMAEEVLHRADQVLHDEAAALDELGEKLSGKQARPAGRRPAGRRPAAPRRAIILASAVVIVIGVLIATHLPSGGPGSFPGSGAGGRVRDLTLPIYSQLNYTPINWDFGKGAAPEGREDQALYETIQGTSKPELILFGAYSLDISAANAGKSTCRSVMLNHPQSGPVTNLHEGLLICVQGVDGVALVEITQKVGRSRVLHLRETYWPGTL